MTEERFRLSDALSRLVVEHSEDIITIRDAEGRIRYTSPSFHRVMGYASEEIIGTTGFEMLHPEDRSTVENAMAEFWRTPGARDSIQYRARHANGSWVSLEVVAYNLLDHPVIQGVLISGRDISDRKRDEAVKEQLIWELKQALAGVNTLAGLLPICASCKKIQNEEGNWQQIELYLREHAPVEFSHGICPECAGLWFPDQSDQ
jgi:PAS domain S-box-containing protein